MKNIVLILFLAVAALGARAQGSIESTLSAIELNNTALKTLRQGVVAQKLENRSGIFLPNPEIGFNRLWGARKGHKIVLNVSQSFDIPTISGLKSKTADEQNIAVEWQYRIDRMNIMLEAKNYCIELIYYNALIKELGIRLAQAVAIETGYKARFKRGDANKLEYNNVKLNLATIKGEMQRIYTEQRVLLAQLKRLNGGVVIEFNIDSYSTVDLESNFDNWYKGAETKSPILAYVKQGIEVARRQLSLSKSMSYPTFSAGYESEDDTFNRFDGFSVSLSLPLWENTNRVKQARAALLTSQLREAESKQQFYGNLELLHIRAAGLHEAALIYRDAIIAGSNSDLLKSAYDVGQISMLVYMTEMGIYYDAITKALEAERDYQVAASELSSFAL